MALALNFRCSVLSQYASNQPISTKAPKRAKIKGVNETQTQRTNGNAADNANVTSSSDSPTRDLCSAATTGMSVGRADGATIRIHFLEIDLCR